MQFSKQQSNKFSLDTSFKNFNNCMFSFNKTNFNTRNIPNNLVKFTKVELITAFNFESINTNTSFHTILLIFF